MDTTEIDNLKTRYARQMSLPEVGEEGQMRLIEKRVAIIGAGGLGSALLPLLVGAGVGHLSLCDDDSISVSNLPDEAGGIRLGEALTVGRDVAVGIGCAESLSSALRLAPTYFVRGVERLTGEVTH